MRFEASIGAQLPSDLADELLKRLPYVSEGLAAFALNSAGTGVVFDVHLGREDEVPLITERIGTVAAKLRAGHRQGVTRTLIRRERPGSYAEDPQLELMKNGELFRFSRGRYGFGPELVDLMNRLDRTVLDVFKEFKAPHHRFPSLIGADALDRCRYFKSFPSSLSIVMHLREDLELLQRFAEEAHWADGALEFPRESLSAAESLLAPAVCFHWYACLSGTKLRGAGTAVTAVGKCFRYESLALEGLERLWDFTMRELIFVGSQEFVRPSRDRCIELSRDLLDRLELPFEINTATDPFFIDSYALQAPFQQGFELKYELLIPLPYKKRLLAIGSVNYHQDFFGRSFGIETDAGQAETGCMAFGLERFALGYLAHHGLSPSRWPGLEPSRG